MRILITGGLGFQGQHLARRLVSLGYQVTLLASPRFSFKDIKQHELARSAEIVQADILDELVIDSLVARVDVVFHLAGKVNPRESLITPKMYFQSNIDGTLVLLEAVRKYQVRLLYVSSCAVYGDGSGLGNKGLFIEESPLVPVDPYGASKVAADRMCYAYHRSYGLDITIIRPFTTYGPGQPAGVFSGLIPAIAHRALAGQPLIVYGDGSAVRDFLYIEDLIDAYELLLTQSTAGQVFNVASGRETKVIDVFNFIAQRFLVPVEYRPRNPTEVRRYAADISKISNLGFVPRVSLTEGLNLYLDSLQEQSLF
jgi:dTDP-glucose 4,6-dehydratase